jgi:hypothetical protein
MLPCYFSPLFDFKTVLYEYVQSDDCDAGASIRIEYPLKNFSPDFYNLQQNSPLQQLLLHFSKI